MKLSATLLLAVQSAKAAETPAGCCQYLTIDADSKLEKYDDQEAWEYAGFNKDGNPYYQSITACGEKPANRAYVALKNISGQDQWLYAARNDPTNKGQAKRNIAGSCLEGTSGMTVKAVSSKVKDFKPTIECYTPVSCPVDAQEIEIPVCMNQCKSAGDITSTCNENATNDAGYSCSCSSGYEAGATTCEDVNECDSSINNCAYNNCMNNDGSYTCAGETPQSYKGVYEAANGEFKQLEFNSFVLLPRPSGSGSDDNGDFEVVDAVAISGDHTEKTIEFFKKYTNGSGGRERVNLKVTVGATGIVGSHTTFSNDGSSYSGSLSLDLAQDSAAVEDAELSKSAEYRVVDIADPNNGSTIFGGRDVLNSVINDSIYYPRVSASGSNEYGTFIDEGVIDTIRDGDSISYKMHKKFSDFTVEMNCKMDGIESGVASGSCDYDVIEGAEAKGWTGTAKTGTMKFGLARETGDGSSKGLIASSVPAAFQLEWTGSDDEMNRVTYECEDFTRFPKISANCDSNYGALIISSTEDTPVMNNVEQNIKLDFNEAGFECNFADTRTSMGEAVAGTFQMTCTDAPFSNGSGTYGGMAKVNGDDVSTEKFVTTPTNMYSKITVTSADGTKKVFNGAKLAALYPRDEGVGDDDYLGSYKTVQLTDTTASGRTTKKKLYEDGEWAEYTRKSLTAEGDTLTFTGDYVDSKGLVGSYVSVVTRDEDPITAQYASMRTENDQIVNAFDSNGNIVDTATGFNNLNLGEGLPYGGGTSAAFGAFEWIANEEPVIDYQAGTMLLKTARVYEQGWRQDYVYTLSYPVGDVNVFVADVTSSGANKPSVVPVSSTVQVIAEAQNEFSSQSMITETGPTEAEALFTTNGGAEYKLKFDNYQRFAGFHPDGTAKVAGNSNTSGLNVALVTGDYSTVADGYYTETMTVNGQECTITYRPTGGPAADESGDYESNCPKLGNGSWKSAKGQGASLDKYVEDETRVDDVSTRKCGQNINGENKNCKDRTITGTMTTVYFPRVEGHGTDDFHGKFKRYSLADTSFTGENTKIVEYDDGFTIRNVYTLAIVNGKVEESGKWFDSNGEWGTYGYDADVKEVVNTEASCPAIGQERDEPWVDAWEVKKGCPAPICPQPMLDITDKWTRLDGRTKRNGVTVKKFKYGVATTIRIPQGFSQWSVGLRFPKNQERGSFQVFNAKFENIYETENETVVMLTKKWWSGGDLLDGDSFTFIADHLVDESNPSLIFFPMRISAKNLNSCFQSNRQQRSGAGSGFEAAVKANRKLKSADDVTRVRMSLGKVISVSSN